MDSIETHDRSLVASPRVRSFREIFEQEYSYVCQTARRLGIHDRDLEDVAHDVFVAVHRKMSDFDHARPVRPWLFGIAFRTVTSHRRLKRNQEQLTGTALDETIDEEPAVDEQIATEQRRRLVHRALATLSEEQRAVFIMSEIDGYPMGEIATALEIPPNTAYSRLRLARDAFSESLRRLVARQKGER